MSSGETPPVDDGDGDGDGGGGVRDGGGDGGTGRIPARHDVVAPFDIAENARRLGHLRWFEDAMFAVTGSWVADASDPELRQMFGVASHLHAEHAERLAARLPELREMSPDDLTVPAHPALSRLVDDLAAITDDAERLAALGRVVVPALVVAYRCHLDRTSAVTDASTVRLTRHALDDLVELWQRSQVASSWMLLTDSDVEWIAARLTPLDRALVESGGVCGAHSSAVST